MFCFLLLSIKGFFFPSQKFFGDLKPTSRKEKKKKEIHLTVLVTEMGVKTTSYKLKSAPSPKAKNSL